MSEPGSPASSRISDDGAQRSVEGDRGSIPTGLVVGLEKIRGNTQTRVNADEVITWFKPIGNAWTDAFWKKY